MGLFPSSGGGRSKNHQSTLMVLKNYGITNNESMRAKALCDYEEIIPRSGRPKKYQANLIFLKDYGISS